MIHTQSTCIACNDQGEEKHIGFPMFVCPSCALMWAKETILPKEYYHDSHVEVNKGKLQSRLRNCKDRLRILKKYANIDNVCDVGTGEGIFLQALQKAGGKNSFGIEPNTKNVTFAQKNELDVYEGSIEDLKECAKKRPIDVVTMYHVIEHVSNPLQSIQTIYDALPSGGYLILETPNLLGYTAKKAGKNWKLIYPEHLFYFNEENLAALLQKVGFEITRHGKRDFNQYHFSIGESLWRLGLRTKTFTYSQHCTAAPKESFNTTKNTAKISILQILKQPLILTLSHIVVFLQRLDYIWIVARKP